jgi:hypothetical protein
MPNIEKQCTNKSGFLSEKISFRVEEENSERSGFLLPV